MCPLANAIISSERSGSPLDDLLDHQGIEARAALRRSAEERARRLPIVLLLPTVTCVLPAFVLVTVVPVVVGAFGRVSIG